MSRQRTSSHSSLESTTTSASSTSSTEDFWRQFTDRLSRNRNLLSRVRHRLTRLRRAKSSAADMSPAAMRLREKAIRLPEIDEDITREFDIRLGRTLCRRDEQYLAEYRQHLAPWLPALAPGILAGSPALGAGSPALGARSPALGAGSTALGKWFPAPAPAGPVEDLYDEVVEYSDDYSDVFSEYSKCSFEDGDEAGSEDEEEVTLNALYYSAYYQLQEAESPLGRDHGYHAPCPPPPPLPRRHSESRPPARPPLPSSYYISL